MDSRHNSSRRIHTCFAGNYSDFWGMDWHALPGIILIVSGHLWSIRLFTPTLQLGLRCRNSMQHTIKCSHHSTTSRRPTEERTATYVRNTGADGVQCEHKRWTCATEYRYSPPVLGLREARRGPTTPRGHLPALHYLFLQAQDRHASNVSPVSTALAPFFCITSSACRKTGP